MSIGRKQVSVRVVLDTNIIVSGLNFHGTERELLRLARSGHFELFLSLHILSEVAGVLPRKFGWNRRMARAALHSLIASSAIVEPSVEVTRVPGHDADNRVLSCAIEATADYLVTGDRRHLLPLVEHEGIKIVSSTEFHKILSTRI